MDPDGRAGRPGRSLDRSAQGEVVFQPNVTLAHAVIYSAIDFSGKRTKIVTDAMHFPSILYLIDQQRRLGAQVAVVPSADGIAVETDRLIEAIDEQTAIVSLSHILFKSAYVHDVAAIAAKARQVGAITIIDGYQAVGTIPVDVGQLGIDVYIGGCLKWLCGGPGTAFVWADPQVRSRLEPKLTGWMAHQAALRICARTGAPRRCLAIAPRHAQYLGTVRGPARPGDHQRNRHRGNPRQSLVQTQRLLDLADRAGYRCTTPRDPARARRNGRH